MEKVTEVIVEAARRTESNEPFVMVTVVKVSGSAPQTVGARMLVDPTGKVFGTVGGGGVEKHAVEKSVEALNSGATSTLDLTLNDHEREQTGSICGGSMTLLIEPFGAGPRLLIFGAGHVAQPTARLAQSVGFRVELFDSRAEWATDERFPGMVTHVDDYERLARGLESNRRDFIVLMSHSHEQDFQLLIHLVRKEWFYLGVLGSQKKALEIRGKLASEGFTPDEIARITSPMGVPIGSHTPEEIAVSIVAELIQLKQTLHNKHKA